MKIDSDQTNQIRKAFAEMQSKEDLLALLNYVKNIIHGDKSFPFGMKQLSFYSNPAINAKRYSSFSIPKKTGGTRTIHAPKRGLKAIQRCLNVVFQNIYNPHEAAYGFVPSRSIVDNARLHEGSHYVYNIDLKDFFPSIDQARIWGRLKFPPFNLNESQNRQVLANIIAAICCHQMEVERCNKDSGELTLVKRYVLPQGAPTSPTITNIICERLDFHLNRLAKSNGLKYSRYADDITFSSSHNVYQADGVFVAKLRKIITEQGFRINEKKTRLQKQGYRQEVTGIIVNDHVNVQKRYIKQLRMWLYYWEKYGYARASGFFVQHYLADKHHVQKGRPDMANVIAGKLDYLKMVKGADNGLYVKLKGRFDALTVSGIIKNNRQEHLNQVLSLIFEEGIDDAMDYYKPTDS